MIKTIHRWHFSASSVVACLAICGMLIADPHSSPSTEVKRVVAQPPPARSRMLEVGEELDYKVSYSFFVIGTIRTRVIAREQQNGKTIYKTRALIDSNPGLSWLVNLHIQFYSEMDEGVFSHFWTEDDSSKDEINYKKFLFDYEQNRAYVEQGKRLPSDQRKIESIDTVAITDRCQDGLSLFFYAREHVHENSQVRVPTLIDNKQVTTYINFMNKRTDAEIDAVDYPVDVVAFNGRADYVGIFGLTGGFRGWFSNDDAQVPILARMNVILGSIKIQLMRWNRPGWQPPKYVEATGQ